MLLAICGGPGGYAQELMPAPQQVVKRDGRLPVRLGFSVAVSGPADLRLYAETARFVKRLSERTGLFLRPDDSAGAAAALQIVVRRKGKLELYEDESYQLVVNDRGVRLEAQTDIGAIRGMETLFQLLSGDSSGYYFPAVEVTDSPRFAWRGLLLDVALHFMPVDELKTTLDGMAAVKMNVLHLHCCNDQGFRVESKIFPRLQNLASDGQYYTQADIKEIINYAGQRGIRVVPEFVVPAHTTAILVAYPELASVKKKYTLQRYFGVFDPVLDPTSEKVYTFLDKLFGEMAALFPDAYFHVGGDENTGKDWEKTPHIKAFMEARGMKDYMQLQTYFNQRLLPIVRKHGKVMMGWDEIFQPGLPKDIVIQSWRGKEAYYSSVKKGYRAILSNGYYIDLIQPASFHYLNDPVPDTVSMTKDETKRVLGGEATMWSELVAPETVDSRIWPRTAAIAERLWSARSVRDTDDMYRRLDVVSLELDGLGLRHEANRAVLLRRLAGGWDVQALGILVDVIEPLKIYERNEGDTMYTVFSPLTKLADVAVPDQRVPRVFRRWVMEFFGKEDEIMKQLLIWKNNDSAFRVLLARSPVLKEAAPLSESLSALGEIGLEAMSFIRAYRPPDEEWSQRSRGVLAKARLQSGRCELQVVESVGALVERARVQ